VRADARHAVDRTRPEAGPLSRRLAPLEPRAEPHRRGSELGCGVGGRRLVEADLFDGAADDDDAVPARYQIMSVVDQHAPEHAGLALVPQHLPAHRMHRQLSAPRPQQDVAPRAGAENDGIRMRGALLRLDARDATPLQVEAAHLGLLLQLDAELAHACHERLRETVVADLRDVGKEERLRPLRAGGRLGRDDLLAVEHFDGASRRAAPGERLLDRSRSKQKDAALDPFAVDARLFVQLGDERGVARAAPVGHDGDGVRRLPGWHR
jgi:hypothetical protein